MLLLAVLLAAQVELRPDEYRNGLVAVYRSGDASVSRVHARITVTGDEARLEDLKSKNGTQVMGETIKGPTVLNDGDEIEFGHVKGWYIVEAADDPPTTTHL